MKTNAVIAAAIYMPHKKHFLVNLNILGGLYGMLYFDKLHCDKILAKEIHSGLAWNLVYSADNLQAPISARVNKAVAIPAR